MFKLLATAFGGPGAAITAFFASAFGKVIGILSLVTLIVGSVTAIYFSWEHAIKAAEDAKYEVAKRDDLIKNKNSEIKILKGTNDAAMEQLQALQGDKSMLDSQLASAQAWIDSQKGGKGDRESSDILKQTFDRLYGKQK